MQALRNYVYVLRAIYHWRRTVDTEARRKQVTASQTLCLIEENTKDRKVFFWGGQKLKHVVIN